MNWYNEGNSTDLLNDASQADYEKNLRLIPGLSETVKSYLKPVDKSELNLMMEFVLHGLAEHSQLSKKKLETLTRFSDLVGSIFNQGSNEEDEGNE